MLSMIVYSCPRLGISLYVTAPAPPAKISPAQRPPLVVQTTPATPSSSVPQPAAATQKSPAEQDTVINQHPPANLDYSKADIGRTIEMYIFRYNTWEPLQILDFEMSRHLHKCRHVDMSEKWLDLKKKPIRSQKDE